MSRVFGFSVLAIFALAACGGGGGFAGGSSSGGGGGGGGGTIVRAALTLNDTSPNETSQLIGSMVAAPTDEPLIIRIVNATLNHRPGNIEGLSIVGGTSGGALLPTATGWESDSMTLTNNDLTPGSFIFSRVIDVSTTDGSGPMIIGVIAPETVMPNTGSTTFTGTGFVTGAVLDETDMVDATGVSTITVNWTGTVDAQITGIAGEVFTTITINGMERNGARFEGGTVALLDGDDVPVTFDLLGDNRSGRGSGGLFGALADNSDPAETGGVFLTTGDRGIVGGGFIANWASSN